jgi:hypothetical protein
VSIPSASRRQERRRRGSASSGRISPGSRRRDPTPTITNASIYDHAVRRTAVSARMAFVARTIAAPGPRRSDAPIDRSAAGTPSAGPPLPPA